MGPGVLVSPSLSLLNLMHTCVRIHTPTATDAETRLTKATITVSFGMPQGKAGPQTHAGDLTSPAGQLPPTGD